MANQYEIMLREEWQKFNNNNKLLPNIMLLGASGCGKSSLINFVFGANIAEVNDTSRGTDSFDTYKGVDHGLGINLIDSRGYELSNGEDESFESYTRAIHEKMEQNRTSAPMDKIHIIWYCISAAGERIQNYDIDTLKMLRNEPELKNRICVVITKCDEDDENSSIANRFKEIIRSDIGNNLSVFEVSTFPEYPLDLERLIQWSAEQLDDSDMREAFILSQNISLKLKRDEAGKAIAFYAAAAAAIGAVPIPVSDAFLLTPLQLAMSTHLIHIYGIDSLANISKGVITTVLIPNLGKAFAGGLLKLIPGIGSLVGGLINGGVAAAITTALGCAISEISFKSCEKLVKGEDVNFDKIFSSESLKAASDYFQKIGKSGGTNKYICSESVDQQKAKEYAREYTKKYKS